MPPGADADRKWKPDAVLLELDLDLLQPLLREFVAAIGLQKSLHVVQRCGGARTYFPREPGPAHWLSQLIGHDDARSLGRICGSDPAVVPKAAAAMRELRNRHFMALRDSSSLNKAARAVGLTRRGAQMVLANERRRPKGGGSQPPEPAPSRPEGEGNAGLRPRAGSHRAACRRSGRSVRVR